MLVNRVSCTRVRTTSPSLNTWKCRNYYTRTCAHGMKIIKENLQVPEMKRECRAVSWPWLLILIPWQFSVGFQLLIFLLVIGYVFLVLYMPGNFLLGTRHFAFTFAVCWIFLYFWTFNSISSIQGILLGTAGVSLPCAMAWKVSQSGKLEQLEDSPHLFSKFQESLPLFTRCSVS